MAGGGHAALASASGGRGTLPGLTVSAAYRKSC